MVEESASVNSQGFRIRLAAVVLLAVLVRLIAIATTRTFDDPDNYLPLARSLASGSGFSINGRLTAYRPPLYPMVLAPLVAALGDRVDWGIAVLHLSLGAGTVSLTSLAVRRLGQSDSRAVLAGLIVACDPTLVWLTRSVMTETLAAFLVAASIASFSKVERNGSFLGGVSLGLGGLCRPSLLAGGVLCSAGRVIFGKVFPSQRLLQSLAIGGSMLGVLSPWALRNVAVFGEPIWTTTHGGYTLALANNPVYYRDVLNGQAGVWTGRDQWFWWDSVNRETAGMTEPEADRYMKNKVVHLAQEQPWDFLRASAARLARFWSIAPAAEVYPWGVRLATSLFTLPIWIGLLVGLTQRKTWNWPSVTAPLQIFGLSAVHMIYWTDMRMRAPIMPAIAITVASTSFRRLSWGSTSALLRFRKASGSKTQSTETSKS